jgi:hypothetical protein
MQQHGYTEIKAFVDACSHDMIICYSFQTLCAMYAYKYTGTKTFTQHPAATSLHALENQPGRNPLLDRLKNT